MDLPLPLTPLDPRLPAGLPFTRAMARSVDVDDHAVTRMLRAGALRRLLRGVYVDATVPGSSKLRSAAVRLVAPQGVVVADRTAAWLHCGIVFSADPDALVPQEWVRVQGRCSRRGLVPRDTTMLGGMWVTSPVRTALDLGRTLSPGWALAALDALMRECTLGHITLAAELPRFAGHAGVEQLRATVAQADARALTPAESVLRLHWNAAGLPTPIPGLTARHEQGISRLALGLPHRLFGAALPGQLTAADLAGLDGLGWRIAVVTRQRVLSSDAHFLRQHLRNEFHRQLLGQVG